MFRSPPQLPRYVLLRFHRRAKRPSFQRTFCTELFSVTSKESGVRATRVDERPQQSGDISTLVLLDSTIRHWDAASCRVALIGSQSHVRPIREPFKRLLVYLWKLCPSKEANFIERNYCLRSFFLPQYVKDLRVKINLFHPNIGIEREFHSLFHYNFTFMYIWYYYKI